MAHLNKYKIFKGWYSKDSGETWVESDKYVKILSEESAKDCPIDTTIAIKARYQANSLNWNEAGDTDTSRVLVLNSEDFEYAYSITNKEEIKLKSSGVTTFDVPTYETSDTGNFDFILLPKTSRVKIASVNGVKWNQYYTIINRPPNITEIEFFGATEVADFSTSSNSLIKLVFHEGITNIGAFMSCCNSGEDSSTGLRKVTIPSTVTRISESLFKDCTLLRKVTMLPKTPPKIGEDGAQYSNHPFEGTSDNLVIYVPSESLDAYKNADGWSMYASKIKAIPPVMKVTYKDGSEKTFYNLTSIEENTDSNKLNAKSVEICEGVTNIGQNAFNNCSSLTSVTIGNSVKTIGTGAFKGCTGLDDITLPYYVASIADYGFADCNKLSEMTVKALTPPSLGDKAIPNTLSTIYVPASSLDAYKSADGWKDYTDKIKPMQTPSMIVTYVDGSIKEFTGLTAIEQDTVPNKFNAKGVIIYEGITSIENRAFDDCYELENVAIGTSVTTIGDWAFSGCESITSITIPDSVISIGESVFNNCPDLTNATIGTSVETIGGNAFVYCYNLETITVKATTPPQLGDKYAIENTIQTIYVPSSSLNSYKSASNWSSYADKIQAIQ